MKRKTNIPFLLSAALVLIIGMSSCSVQEKDTSPADRQQTFAEIGDTLKELEIGGITKKLTDELEASYAEIPPEIELNKTAMLLSFLGMGTYDYSENMWTPSTNGVYSFDAEIFGIEKMYTDFLEGVSALDEEELDFKNIQEDTSNINWEEGTGTKTVSFEWKGETFRLEAEIQNDWFDLNFAKELNQIIIENQSGKRLFFATDGYQEYLVFYHDADWAMEFQNKTGLVLSEPD